MDRAAAFAAAQKQLRSLGGTFSRLLSHPLMLILVGGAISALIVPTFTQRWQDHQRELDTQTALSTEMTRAATEFLVASRLLLEDDSKLGERRARQALRRWEVDSAIIGAKLRAYYPQDDIAREWEAFDDAVQGFYVLATGSEVGVDLIEDALKVEVEYGIPQWFGAWALVERTKDKLVSNVLRTTPSV